MERSSRKPSSELETSPGERDRTGSAAAKERKFRRERVVISSHSVKRDFCAPRPSGSLSKILASYEAEQTLLTMRQNSIASGSGLGTGTWGGGTPTSSIRISRRRPSSFLLFIATFLSCLPVAYSQNSPQRNSPPSLRVHGSATLSVEPDQAQFDIGVVTQAATAKAATDQNTSQSSILMRALSAAFRQASNGLRAPVARRKSVVRRPYPRGCS